MSTRRTRSPLWLAVAAVILAVAVAVSAFESGRLVDGWLRARQFGAAPNPAFAPLDRAARSLGWQIVFGCSAALLGGAALWLSARERRTKTETQASPKKEVESSQAFAHEPLQSSGELFTQSNDLVFAVDGDGRFRTVNPRWLETMGYTSEEARQLHFEELLRPDFRPLWQQIRGGAERGDRTPQFDTILLARDGREVAVEGFCWPRLEDGRLVELRGILLDVTQRQRAERERLVGEERFRMLFERAPLPLLVYDTETLFFLEVNEAAVLGYGYTRDELLALQVFDLLPRDEAERFRANRSSAETHRGIWRHRLKAGWEIHVEVTAHPVTYAGRLARLVFARDVTEELKVHQALERSVERYRELFENSQGLLCTHDLDGLLTAINPAAARHLGYEPDEMIGKSLASFLAPGDDLWATSYLERIRGVPNAEGMMRVVTRSGAVRHWWYQNARFEKPGAKPYVLGHAIDVTERRRAERALERSERRYRELFENSGDLIQSVSAEGKMEYVNPLWLSTLGYETADLEKLTLFDVLAPSEWPHCQNVLAQLQAGATVGAIAPIETVFLTKSGRPVYVEGTASAVFEGGVFRGSRGFFRDVSDRRSLEAEKQRYLERIERQNLDLEVRNREVEKANQLKSEFLATMSHELRTPLTAIIGFSDLLAEQIAGPLNESQASYLGYVRKGSRHLLQLINDVLDMSKIEAGKIELSCQDLAVAEVVGEALATVAPLAAAKGIVVETELPSALSVYADRARFKQILSNLVSNAVKFTPEGGSLRVSASALDDFTCLSVEDTGVGIAPEDQESIFAAFHQIQPKTGSREGTGLGLAIVRRLVERQGGKIWVESAVGKGSTFTFLLPSKLGAGRRAPEVEESEASASPERRTRPLVLVIDDDTAARDFTVSLLRMAGYQTVAADHDANVAGAVKFFHPDLVILEVVSATTDGWGTLAALRKSAALAEVPILVSTELDERRRAYALGANDVLRKPFSREAFLELVAKHAVPPRDEGGAVLVVGLDKRVSDAVLAAGYRPLAARDGREALDIAQQAHPAAVIVDLGLPEVDGYQTIVRLRADPQFAAVPIVAFNAPGGAVDVSKWPEGPTVVLAAGELGALATELARWLPTPSALSAPSATPAARGRNVPSGG